MAETWRPITDLPDLVDKTPGIEVRSAEGQSCMAWRDPDTGRWMDISDPEYIRELGFEPVEYRAASAS